MENSTSRVMIVGSIMIFPYNEKVLVDYHNSDGVKPVKLARLRSKEFLVLKHLAAKAGDWVTTKELMGIFWPKNMYRERNAYVTICRIRKELRMTCPGVEKQLQSEREKGFKLSAAPEQ